jgi:hypothetical protein
MIVPILKIFSPKKLKKLAILTQNKAKFCKIFYYNIGFYANCRKSPKIVIIASTPGSTPTTSEFSTTTTTPAL